MIILMIVVGLFTVVPFLGIGISLVVSKGEKGDWAVAGWNTMSPEKRAKYNKAVLFTFVGWFFIAVAILTVITLVVTALEHAILTPVSWIVWTAFLAVGVVYANVSKRFRN